MFSFLLKVFFIYWIIRFIFKAIAFFLGIFLNQAKSKPRSNSYQKPNKPPPKHKNVVDAEFREVDKEV